MDEYIEREAAKRAIMSQYLSRANKTKYADVIDAVPAADVAPVVRCKDCKHYKTAYCSMDIWHNTVTIYRAKPNDFCSRGVRKEEVDNG